MEISYQVQLENHLRRSKTGELLRAVRCLRGALMTPDLFAPEIVADWHMMLMLAINELARRRVVS